MEIAQHVLRIANSGRKHDLGDGVLVMPKTNADGGYLLSFESLGVHSQVSFDSDGSLPDYLRNFLSKEPKTMTLLSRLPNAKVAKETRPADFIPYEAISRQ